MTAAEVSRSLLTEQDLERSSVVANNAMNRERGLAGVNSYTKDLGFNPLAYLQDRIEVAASASWLDLCCGSGRALIQAGRKHIDGLHLTGIDLVGYFDDHSDLPTLNLVTASVSQWQPRQQFDLITCVHGLHYVGDKLGVISRVLAWLTHGGRFAAHLDLTSIKIDNDPHPSRVKKALQAGGLRYDTQRRLLTCHSRQEVNFGYRYLGADDTAGPNFTGQPGVDSYYESIKD